MRTFEITIKKQITIEELMMIEALGTYKKEGIVKVKELPDTNYQTIVRRLI